MVFFWKGIHDPLVWWVAPDKCNMPSAGTCTTSEEAVYSHLRRVVLEESIYEIMSAKKCSMIDVKVCLAMHQWGRKAALHKLGKLDDHTR